MNGRRSFGVLGVLLFCAASLTVGVGVGRGTAPESTHTHSEAALHYDCDGCLPELRDMVVRLNESMASGKVAAQRRPQGPPKPKKPLPKKKAVKPEKE